MSNNKKMKLYTEEQVREASKAGFRLAMETDGGFDDWIELFINALTPIELPTDEEIDAHVEEDFLNSTEVHKYSQEVQLLMKAMCKAGALWMRDKIGGNNEQQ